MSAPIRIRLTAWYATLLALIIAALGAFLVLQLRTDLRQTVDDEARAVSQSVIDAVGDRPGEPRQNHPVDMAEDAIDFRRAASAIMAPAAGAAQMIGPTGQVLERYGAAARTGALTDPDAVRALRAGGPHAFTARLEDGQRYRIRTTPVLYRHENSLLVVAVSLSRVEQALRRVLVLLLLAGPAALLATALAGYWLAAKALRPVQRMISDTEAIGTDRLDERVAVPASRDEIGRLAVTLNAMLARIEAGTREKRRLIADASHELRNPLAAMRAEIDVSLRGDDLSDNAREVLDSARDEVDRISRTVDNLLTLAEADEGRLRLLTVQLDLRQAIEDAARAVRPLAMAKSISIVVTGEPYEAQADAQRLRLVLTNLLDNAIKFSPNGGVVRIHSWRSGGEVGITVTDQGPGIAAEDRDELFERFYRPDSARSRQRAGGGLGLAICREVASAHGGRVWVESELGAGSAFSLALPAWRSIELDDEVTRAYPPGHGVPS